MRLFSQMTLLWISLCGFQTWAQTPTGPAKPDSACTEYLRLQGSFQVHRFEADDGLCFFSASPFNPPTSMKYRSYLFTSDGALMVFNSFGPQANSNGARVFYFFPRNQIPDMQALTNRTILKSATAGIELMISTTKLQIVGMRGGAIKEASTISPSNAGGIEFSNLKTLSLDAGFQLGSDPTANLKRTSKFVDIRSRTCTVKNSEVFTVTTDGNPRFQFTDLKLKSFLSQRCPGLAVNF